MTMLRFLLVGVLLCASVGGAAARGFPPDGWQQWQPQRMDASDYPLYRTVSIWRESVPLAELLTSISDQIDVGLHAAPDVADIPVSVYVGRGTASGVMSCLAHLVNGYWYVPLRGEGGHGAEYWLGGRNPEMDLTEQWMYDRQQQVLHTRSREHRAEWEQRIQQYRNAYALKPDELRGQSEATDPWLCATVLNPVLRPMIAAAISLSAAQEEQLLADTQISIPLSALPSSLAPHLQSWVAGPVSGTATPVPDPDRMPRFADAEGRWAHSFVTLQWHKNGLQFRLTVPDTGSFQEDAMVLPHVSPFWARYAMVRLGYVQDTPEYKQAALEEAKRWEQAAAKRGGASGPGQDEEFGRIPECPLLERSASLPASRDVLSVASALEQIAQQADVNVVATWLGSADSVSAQGMPDSPATAEAILSAIRKQRGVTWSWECPGRFLVVVDTDAQFLAASEAANESAKWAVDTMEGGSIGVDEVVRALGSMDPLEMSYAEEEIFRRALAGPHRALNLGFYTSLNTNQREVLAKGEHLDFNQLGDKAKREVLLIAKQTHPWLTADQLRTADLRREVRPLSSGTQGIYVTLQYNAAGDPDDRDLLFWFPLEITVKHPPTGRSASQNP